jgi:hypothetical protein
MVGKKRGKKFDISNKLAYTLIVILSIILLGVGVYAIGAVPNPGHAISQLQPCDNGQTLVVSGGVWTCATYSNFVINASGVCYSSSNGTCSVSGLKSCYYDQWYAISAACGSMSQGVMATACGSKCPSIACNGDSSSCVSGKSPLTVSNSVTSASCSGGTWIDCHCQGSGNYYEEMYTPAGNRCV